VRRFRYTIIVEMDDRGDDPKDVAQAMYDEISTIMQMEAHLNDQDVSDVRFRVEWQEL
jgi:hypothetical protein